MNPRLEALLKKFYERLHNLLDIYSVSHENGICLIWPVDYLYTHNLTIDVVCGQKMFTVLKHLKLPSILDIESCSSLSMFSVLLSMEFCDFDSLTPLFYGAHALSSRQVPHTGKEMLILPGHLISPSLKLGWGTSSCMWCFCNRVHTNKHIWQLWDFIKRSNKNSHPNWGLSVKSAMVVIR